VANRENRAIQKDQGTPYPSAPRLLTLPKAAAYLGLTVWAMRERIWAGHIPFIQFPGGRKLYIDMSDLDGFIQKNKKTFD
jgi:excisionase family DNA binding protein